MEPRRDLKMFRTPKSWRRKPLPVYQKTQGFLIFKSPAFWASIISKNIETGESLNLDAIETKKNVLVKFLLLALRMIRLFKNQ